MQTLDFVSSLKNFPNPSSVYIRLCKHRKNVFCCFYKITFPWKKKNSLFRFLIKREILTTREVLSKKANVRVIISRFAIKLLSKKGFSRLKCQLKRKKNIGTACLKRFSKFHPTREWVNKVNLSSFRLKNILNFVLVWLAREEQNILPPYMFTYSHANTSLGQSERARTILVLYKRCYQLYSSL